MSDFERPEKHSLTLRGHRTSVSLERAFWMDFKEIAKAKSMSINELAAVIDAERGVDSGLASAIRVYVLGYWRDQARGLIDK